MVGGEMKNFYYCMIILLLIFIALGVWNVRCQCEKAEGVQSILPLHSTPQPQNCYKEVIENIQKNRELEELIS